MQTHLKVSYMEIKIIPLKEIPDDKAIMITEEEWKRIIYSQLGIPKHLLGNDKPRSGKEFVLMHNIGKDKKG